MNVHLNDILQHLVGRSGAPSTMGAQLDRLRYGLQTTPDPFRAREEVESNLLQQAVLLRCIDDFERRPVFRVVSRDPVVSKEGDYKTLEKISKASKRGQGEIALGILRAYHERCTSVGMSQERGMLEVYQYVASIAPTAVPPPPKDEPDLLQAFRANTAKRARSLACEAYADALLALQQHVRLWNKKQTGK